MNHAFAGLAFCPDRIAAAKKIARLTAHGNQVNVLKSLVSRVDPFDPKTGEPINSLLVRRPEKAVLLIVVSGEKGLAGAFN
ncbi:MAG: hypothetical protein ACRD4F_15155, partial [Candidatus Angelobacter sp.]